MPDDSSTSTSAEATEPVRPTDNTDAGGMSIDPAPEPTAPEFGQPEFAQSDMAQSAPAQSDSPPLTDEALPSAGQDTSSQDTPSASSPSLSPAPMPFSPPTVPDVPSRAKPTTATRGLSYAVDIVFCIDVTGSMTPIIDAVKANAVGFYQDVQNNLTAKGKNVDQLRVRVIAFRDFNADPDGALQESSFFALPAEQDVFSAFVSGLVAEGGGDAPESGLEALALAINSPWTSEGDRRRQVIVVWTDQPAHPLNFAVLPPDLASSVPTSFSDLTDLWEDPQGPVGSSSKRLILFAPDGPGWSDISASWENVVHHPSQAGGGLSDVDYGTIVDSIGNSV